MKKSRIITAKYVVIFFCYIPFLISVFKIFGFFDGLGANPIENLLHSYGKNGLNLILITLLITPIRQITKINYLIQFRRILGLAAFFYVLMHALTYIVLDRELKWLSIIEDIIIRPYITLGFIALILLIPLAITSTNKMQRLLKKNWGRLHKLIYLIGPLAVVHFFWQVRVTTLEPIIYSSILLLTLGYRFINHLKKKI
ncbi:MAG: sulfoxide reductase heme-binding subunit YedZ [Gammaproteobacteria bacterium]|nr:sulfoxide reductase heme-binding subunit YedZ [Gammaproteobacteria bacterium]|tara:strand:- start:1528 stop:2124 length:597 start_codon:yes stop_codon:yes gene_type:complete